MTDGGPERMRAEEVLESLEELVHGGQAWHRDKSSITEYRLVKMAKRSWFYRCCGQRMRHIYPRMRYQDAVKFPPGSRRAQQWWGWHWGWACDICGYLMERK